MTRARNLYSASHYEKVIQANYITDHCGFDLKGLGKKVYESTFPVNLESIELLDVNALKNQTKDIVDFVNRAYSFKDERPIWYKINVIDQAVNEYVGVGFLNRNTDWLGFIIGYLSNDRAEQSGDTILTVFDHDFKWAICFTLSQDDSLIYIEKYIS